jgi:aminoglycoside 3-N-acetyltransferase I
MMHASTSLQIRRLRAGDRDLARHLFAVMAEVFEEPGERLSDSYLDALLGRETFWAIAALSHDEVVGGLTAHTLPMTRTESAEVFIYDVAVRADRQRQGIGRQLVTALRAAASATGFGDVFVPADTADGHALDFYRALGGVPAPVTMFTFSGAQPSGPALCRR